MVRDGFARKKPLRVRRRWGLPASDGYASLSDRGEDSRQRTGGRERSRHSRKTPHSPRLRLILDAKELKMSFRLLTAGLAAALLALFAADAPKTYPTGYADTEFLPGGKWRVHDDSRPRPPVVAPGTASAPERPGKAPSDAVVLFDGTDLSHWVQRKRAEGRSRRPGKSRTATWRSRPVPAATSPRRSSATSNCTSSGRLRRKSSAPAKGGATRACCSWAL